MFESHGKARRLFVSSLALLLVTGMAGPAAAGKWKLDPGDTEQAFKATDPENPKNQVIQTAVTSADPEGRAVVFRKFSGKVRIQDLTNVISAKYRFTAPRQCYGGSPRFELEIKSSLATDPSGIGRIHGHFGDVNFGGVGNCQTDKWVYEDMTNDVTKWSTTQFDGGKQNASWDEVVSQFSFDPNHRVISCALVDDTTWNAQGQGIAHYDQIQCGDLTLENHKDATGK